MVLLLPVPAKLNTDGARRSRLDRSKMTWPLAALPTTPATEVGCRMARPALASRVYVANTVTAAPELLTTALELLLELLPVVVLNVPRNWAC